MGSGVHNAIPRTWTDGQASPTVSGKYFLGNAASQVTTGSYLILTSTVQLQTPENGTIPSRIQQRYGPGATPIAYEPGIYEPP